MNQYLETEAGIGMYRQHYAAKVATLPDRLAALREEHDRLPERYQGAPDFVQQRQRELAQTMARLESEARDAAERVAAADGDPALLGYRTGDISDVDWMEKWGLLYTRAQAADRARNFPPLDLGPMEGFTPPEWSRGR
jgi:hypothetical protein